MTNQLPNGAILLSNNIAVCSEEVRLKYNESLVSKYDFSDCGSVQKHASGQINLFFHCKYAVHMSEIFRAIPLNHFNHLQK